MTSEDLDRLVARSAVVGGYDDRRLVSREDFDALVEVARSVATLRADLLDTAGIRARHLDPERFSGRTMYEGHIAVDLATLVTEVEHIREVLSGRVDKRCA